MGDRWYMQQREGRRMSSSAKPHHITQPDKTHRKTVKSSTVPDWSSDKKRKAGLVKRPIVRFILK